MMSDSFFIIALQILTIGIILESYLIFILLVIALVGYVFFLKKENEWRKELTKRIVKSSFKGGKK